MKTCEQTQGLSILEHGEAVSRTFKAIFEAGDSSLYCIPDCIKEHQEFLLSLCPPASALELYHVFHDCGKPLCLTIDAEGRRHFPGHALHSARAWLAAGGSYQIGRLIEHDMDMHTMKPADLESYHHLEIAPTLLLTAWAELNANAQMFGGTSSTSFKIKSKSLTRLSKALIIKLKELS